MLNFRNELDTIKEQKTSTPNKYEKSVNNILKMILEYYKARTASELRAAREIVFGTNSKNEVTGKMYDMSGNCDRDISIIEACDSKEDAERVIALLEEEFKSEGFFTFEGRDGIFTVIIVV